MDAANSELWNAKEKIHLPQKRWQENDQRTTGEILGRLGEAIPHLLDRRWYGEDD